MSAVVGASVAVGMEIAEEYRRVRSVDANLAVVVVIVRGANAAVKKLTIIFSPVASW